MNALATLVEGPASYAGGLAETAGDGMLVILPPEVSRSAGVAETFELSLEGEVSYESDLLDRLSPLLGEGGRRELWWPGELYLKRSGVEELVVKELAAVNGLLRPSGARTTAVAYDTYVFRYTAASEETSENMVSVSASTLTGTSLEGLAEALSHLPRSGVNPPPHEPADAALSFAAACSAAERRIRSRLEPFVRSLERRLARDAKRLRSYYGALTAQADGRRFRGSEEEKKERKAAIARELDRKLHELDSRYAVRVGVEAVCVSRAILPVVLVPFTAVRRRTEREYTGVWNPVLKGFEPLPCANCSLPVKSFHLCDPNAHIICPDCARTRDLRRSCPACRR